MVATSCRKKTWLPALVFITDRHKIAHIFTVIRHLPHHTLVIVRDYDHPDRETYARKIQELCRKRSCKLLIAGDPALAATIRADGLHLPERHSAIAPQWRKSHPHWLITTSAHSLQEVKKAACYKVDAVLISPVFHTSTHPDARPLGVSQLKVLAGKSPVPVYALGGITASNILRLRNANITGIAAINGFHTSL